MSEEQQVRLRVRCGPLPPGDWGGYESLSLGLQRGRNEVVPGTPSGDGSLQFECEVRARPEEDSPGVRFLGPWVHGSTQERILYLVWEGRRGAGQERFRRVKVHLKSIRWEQVEAAVRAERPLEARISGVGKDGSPACASVPLLGEGWTLGD